MKFGTGSGSTRRVAWATAWVVAALVSGCATPPAQKPATEAPPSTATTPPQTSPETTKPAPPPVPIPQVSPAQAKAEAQKLSLQGIDQLQNGDESAARATLDQALALDASNELARKLRDQIDADPEKELGSVFFRYTVQRDDSMSKLAQLYLGDRFRFYILARYNEMANPSRLAAGQVIKIPGKGPIAPPPTTARPGARPADAAPTPPTTPPPEVVTKVEPPPESASQQDAKAHYQKGLALQKSGNLEGAYAAFNDAAKRDPNNRDAATQRDATKRELIRRYDREAVQAFQRQNLDLAIARWTSLLELDPNNQKAKLERERATDLKRRMTEKFGG